MDRGASTDFVAAGAARSRRPTLACTRRARRAPRAILPFGSRHARGVSVAGHRAATPALLQRPARLAATPRSCPASARLDRVRLVAMDMDSTLITIECIDEIADMLGIKPEVAAITAERDARRDRFRARA